MLDAEFWQQYFKTYDILNIVIPYQELMEELIKESVVNKGDLVLDAGAGTGNLAVRLKQRGANVVALDNSEEGLRQLRVKDQEIGIIFHDLAKPLSFSDDYFDKIVSNNVIYTLAPGDRDKVFKEFYRILKPGGILIMTNWNLWQVTSKKSFWNNFLKSHFTDYRLRITDYKDIITLWQNRFPLYYHAFTLGELKKLFKKSNFKILANYYVKDGKKANWFNGKNVLTVGQKI